MGHVVIWLRMEGSERTSLNTWLGSQSHEPNSRASLIFYLACAYLPFAWALQVASELFRFTVVQTIWLLCEDRGQIFRQLGLLWAYKLSLSIQLVSGYKHVRNAVIPEPPCLAFGAIIFPLVLYSSRTRSSRSLTRCTNFNFHYSVICVVSSSRTLDMLFSFHMPTFT